MHYRVRLETSSRLIGNIISACSLSLSSPMCQSPSRSYNQVRSRDTKGHQTNAQIPLTTSKWILSLHSNKLNHKFINKMIHQSMQFKCPSPKAISCQLIHQGQLQWV